MNEIQIRRLFMEDYVWERAHRTWKDLRPLKNFNVMSKSDESPLQHYLRLRPKFNIPLEVIEQWLYPHYYNVNTINNYGWLNYDEVSFEETYMSLKKLTLLHVVSRYEPYVRTREASTPFEGFSCVAKDNKHWQESGTWRVPPIIVDVSTLDGIPDHAELKSQFQLVEGHSRLGYLLALRRVGILDSESQHRVYRMYVCGSANIIRQDQQPKD